MTFLCKRKIKLVHPIHYNSSSIKAVLFVISNNEAATPLRVDLGIGQFGLLRLPAPGGRAGEVELEEMGRRGGFDHEIKNRSQLHA